MAMSSRMNRDTVFNLRCVSNLYVLIDVNSTHILSLKQCLHWIPVLLKRVEC